MTQRDDDWLHSANSALEPHQQEPSEQWLDRILDLLPGARRSFRVDDDGTIRARGETGPAMTRALAPSRVVVLRSLLARASGAHPAPDRRDDDGAGWVLCDERRETFLLTRKDERHPNERCRGLLACLSGGVEAGESPWECALRELYEELRDPTIADAIAERAVPLGAPTLPSVQWDGEYRMSAWLAAAPGDVFTRWLDAWSSRGALSEARPVVLGRDEVRRAIEQERASRGSAFVASHHELLTLALDQTSTST